jgi:hypothetical protein
VGDAVIIPDNPALRTEYIQWILDVCLQSKKDRKDLYDRRRNFFLYGTGSDQDIIYNRLESHLDLVSSFLYSPDHAEFSLSAPPNADDATVKQFQAAQDAFNNDFRDAGLFDSFADALIWSTVFDSVFLKMGWSDVREEETCEMVEPWAFGVFAEEITELESQQAFVHCYHIDYDNACQRLIRAGLGDKIPQLNVVNTPFESPFPELITRMIIASTAGENLGGNVTGSVNPSYVARPSYHAKVDRPLVQMSELTVWDDELKDYRLFFIVDPGIILSDSKETIRVLKAAGGWRGAKKQQEQFYDTECNLFFPKDHPFVQVRPYNMYKYFWGKSHIESLIPLQEWSNERLEQIHDILDKQANPARVLSGFLGLSDEKAEAFGGADTWVMDQLPQAQVKELYPEMPPDIFADYNSIGMLFIEASGLTEVLQGKGTEGVRSRGHAKELKTTGAGRIKKTATRLEAPLVRMGDLVLRLNMRNNPDEIHPDPKDDGKPGDPFYYHNLVGEYSLRIAGHSHSPLFADDSKEMAALLFKAQAIDQEGLLRMLNPPNRDNLIHALRSRQKKQAAAALQRMKMGLPPPGAPAPKGKHKGNGLPAQI